MSSLQTVFLCLSLSLSLSIATNIPNFIFLCNLYVYKVSLKSEFNNVIPLSNKEADKFIL